jgi:starch synthase
MKTGGLADVCASLPRALLQMGADARVLLPAYRDAVARAPDARRVATLRMDGITGPVSILETQLPNRGPTVWLVEHAPSYDRPGNPYLDDRTGKPWPDNAERYALLCRAAAVLARDGAGLDWRPDVVHAHDWQTGLVAPLLSQSGRQRPRTVYSIHNLAYMGLFDRATFDRLGLPSAWWSLDALELFGQMSFLKAGVVYSDWITTVSPTYAREIQTPALGWGLEGLMRHRASRLVGILNGIDEEEWNPRSDRYLARTYEAGDWRSKSANKQALLDEFDLPATDLPLVGSIGRLVEQKGVDLVLEALERDAGIAQWIFLGTGERHFEEALADLAHRHPERIAARLGYDEGLAHRIEAGADFFLMPSRFEPCGLNQMYSMRYGTPPIVRRTGGLADTVVHADPGTLADGTASGIVFDSPDVGALRAALSAAVALYRRPDDYRRVALAGMSRNFGWAESARRYRELYEREPGTVIRDS